MVHSIQTLFLLFSFDFQLIQSLPSPEHTKSGASTTAKSSNRTLDLNNLSTPSSGLQKRASSSRPLNQCGPDEVFFYSCCDYTESAHENDLSKYKIVCLPRTPLGTVRIVRGRCGAEEVCFTRHKALAGGPVFPVYWRAYCVSHAFYVDLINSGKPQQRVVSAAQLGLPSSSDEGSTAAYGINALVVDGVAGQNSVNATNMDMVAIKGSGRGSMDSHCDDCNEVGFETIPQGVTRFIVGVTLQGAAAVAVTAGRIVFDIYKK